MLHLKLYWMGVRQGLTASLSTPLDNFLNILVLSPHRDDAAFSLSLSISRWLTAGHHVTLLNVFTRSLYAPYSDAESKLESELLNHVSALRKREDENFLAALPGTVAMIDLDVVDAPIRLECDASFVCDMDVVPDDAAIPVIRKALQNAFHGHSDLENLALVLPLGLGHHVDHRTGRDAALPFTTDLPCAFYEELPYAARRGVRVDLSQFREETNMRLHQPLFPVLCHGIHTRPTELKRRLAMLYKSQIDAQLADVIARFSCCYQGAERLWANEAWLAVARREKLSNRQRDLEAEPLPA